MFERLNPEVDPRADQLRAEMMGIISWAESQAPRTLQVNLGPSELSNACDRMIAYRLAQIGEINDGADFWPATVGTAIHMWLEAAVKKWAKEHHDSNWQTEVDLPITPDITGHGDLFHVGHGRVIDHKSAGKDRMKEVLEKGPPEKYINQVNIYGLGYELLGYTVKEVALVFYPRAGRFRDIFAWVGDYEPHRAFAAIDRIPRLRADMEQLGIRENPHRWEQIPATPGHDCGYCPFYNFKRTPELGASDEGCPGR